MFADQKWADEVPCRLGDRGPIARAIIALRLEHPEWTGIRIGKELGVTRSHVYQTLKRDGLPGGAIQCERLIDGKKRCNRPAKTQVQIHSQLMWVCDDCKKRYLVGD